MKDVFVGGVHGVGKSTCCKQVADELGAVHVKASDIIRQERSDAVSKDGKAVANVDGNQVLLVLGLERLRQKLLGKIVLLDGHFCLQNTEGQIERLSIDVFELLRLDVLVCFEDQPAAIADRLGRRDGTEPDAEGVGSLQALEVEHMKAVGQLLRLPCSVLEAFDVNGLRMIVEVLSEK